MGITLAGRGLEDLFSMSLCLLSIANISPKFVKFHKHKQFLRSILC